eukprot:Unigene12919_Nuclearia_a/m.39191 Unigene12919_Nuclearia_a/g.39191  ORF Unigene12919_Nuclearia_a/g.39191 Unigene12919_Nuclearia_a/m.39191 type:complete len:382 (-) Unigene12919_Nuclearia_a:538-1683(-)
MQRTSSFVFRLRTASRCSWRPGSVVRALNLTICTPPGGSRPRRIASSKCTWLDVSAGAGMLSESCCSSRSMSDTAASDSTSSTSNSVGSLLLLTTATSPNVVRLTSTSPKFMRIGTIANAISLSSASAAAWTASRGVVSRTGELAASTDARRDTLRETTRDTASEPGVGLISFTPRSAVTADMNASMLKQARAAHCTRLTRSVLRLSCTTMWPVISCISLGGSSRPLKVTRRKTLTALDCCGSSVRSSDASVLRTRSRHALLSSDSSVAATDDAAARAADDGVLGVSAPLAPRRCSSLTRSVRALSRLPLRCAIFSFCSRLSICSSISLLTARAMPEPSSTSNVMRTAHAPNRCVSGSLSRRHANVRVCFDVLVTTSCGLW